MIETIKTSHQVIDIRNLPAEFHDPLESYAREIGSNEELVQYQGRQLVFVGFCDAADDITSDDIVQQLADGVIGFDQYPFDGIFWDVLGVEFSSYAGFLRATRYLRTVLPAEVVEADSLHFLV
jgi:hypothetical protein